MTAKLVITLGNGVRHTLRLGAEIPVVVSDLDVRRLLEKLNTQEAKDLRSSAENSSMDGKGGRCWFIMPPR